ncbi:DUF4150 domain-containing protein [Lysobacter firmicutimachus]|uniref:DUF4150 domain-containing protein n=1 Tax=Lysobacter firmicutimachus TaxID=1792846 RepID=A0AAU8MQ08_9GAMM
MTMPVNTTMTGQCLAISVNMTPPAIPIPYCNIGSRSQAVSTCPHIQICGAPACNLSAIITSSNGDQPGSMGGVASGTVGSTCRNIKGSSKLSLSCMPATCLSHPTLQNSTNTVGSDVSPCQGKVLCTP